MKEHPILFNGKMVQAILEGHKAQTRRVIKPQPVLERGVWKWKETAWDIANAQISDTFPADLAPYQPGNYLWVREGWRIAAWDEDNGTLSIQYKADGAVGDMRLCEDPDAFNRYWLQSSDDAEKQGIKPDMDGQYHWDVHNPPTRWRPSIHMPRWASRITLEVTGVRIERVQEIGADDAIAEGININEAMALPTDPDSAACGIFSGLWDSINAKRGYSWDTNPWVWAIRFKRVGE